MGLGLVDGLVTAVAGVEGAAPVPAGAAVTASCLGQTNQIIPNATAATVTSTSARRTQ